MGAEATSDVTSSSGPVKLEDLQRILSNIGPEGTFFSVVSHVQYYFFIFYFFNLNICLLMFLLFFALKFVFFTIHIADMAGDTDGGQNLILAHNCLISGYMICPSRFFGILSSL